MKTIYDRIKEYRKKLGLTQKELAAKLGYESQSIVAKIESGHVDLPQSRMIAFSNALGVSPGELMGIVGSSHNLSDSEIELLQLFRACSREAQDHSLNYLRFLCVAEEVQVYGNGSED